MYHRELVCFKRVDDRERTRDEKGNNSSLGVEGEQLGEEFGKRWV